eukprot:3350316-Heterocapsa_arctica.AAC.1
MSADIEMNWQSSSRRWQNEQAVTQNQSDWEAKQGLNEQSMVYQDLASNRESVIAGLQNEMVTRDALNAALALSKATEIECLLKQNRVMQFRLDTLAAAAPLRPVQVMAQTPSQIEPRLRTGDTIQGTGPNGGPGPPPSGGG